MSARLVGGRYRFRDWSMPDPHSGELVEAMYAARYRIDALTQGEAYEILAAAGAYIHLAAHPAGTESVVVQLRELRRAIKAELRKTGGGG